MFAHAGLFYYYDTNAIVVMDVEGNIVHEMTCPEVVGYALSMKGVVLAVLADGLLYDISTHEMVGTVPAGVSKVAATPQGYAFVVENTLTFPNGAVVRLRENILDMIRFKEAVVVSCAQQVDLYAFSGELLCYSDILPTSAVRFASDGESIIWASRFCCKKKGSGPQVFNGKISSLMLFEPVLHQNQLVHDVAVCGEVYAMTTKDYVSQTKVYVSGEVRDFPGADRVFLTQRENAVYLLLVFGRTIRICRL